MRIRMAACAVPAVLLTALLSAPGLHGQEAGDRVIVTLKSGKKFDVVLVSRTPTEVKFKLGENEITLPNSSISSMDAVGKAGRSSGPVPEDAPAPAPASAPASAPSSAAAPKAGARPAPTSITMKDGTVFTGFVVARGDGKVWIVEGEPRALGSAFIDKIEGDTGGGGSAATTTGTGKDRARALVQEFACGDDARELSAFSALEALGPDAIAQAVVEGMSDKEPKVRRMCVTLAARVQQDSALPRVYELLKADPDAAVRKATAETLGSWPAEGAGDALLRSAGWDRSPDVRTAALTSLARYAGPDMVKPLIDMLAEFPDDATALPALYGAIRKAAGKELWTTKDRAGWMKWWDAEGGQEEISEAIAARKRAEAGDTDAGETEGGGAGEGGGEK